MISTVVLFLFIIIVLLFIFSSKGSKVPLIFSHWHHLTENLQQSSQEFYNSLETALHRRNLPDTKLSRIDHSEGGTFSAKREYLRVKRKEHIFDVCAAPFGNGFFISWWLGEKSTQFWSFIMKIPFIGPFFVKTFNPETYYRLDTALMFQESVHAAVLEVLDQTTKIQGLRALSELERKPILHDIFKR